MVVHLVYYVTTMLNCCINKQGISNYLSPREIVLRRCLDWNIYCTSGGVPLEFGCYVEAHEDKDVTNTNRPRTYAAIYLGSTTNLQGTKKLFDLKTGVVKKPRSVTKFPMPDHVIDLVNAWGNASKKISRRIQ